MRIVQLGSERKEKELRFGTVRRPPRGVRKEDYSKLNYYDVWLPILSPSMELMKLGKEGATNEKAWNQFKRMFKAEMNQSEAAQVLNVLAALSHHTQLSIGCYCLDENRCHRSILNELLRERGADIQ